MTNIEKRILEVERRIEELKLKASEIYKKLMGRENTNISCIHCGYSWETRSKMSLISCGNCGGKTPNKTRKENDKIVRKIKETKDPLDYCSKCNKKLKELECNPGGHCDKCWGKIVRKADMSCFDDI